MLTGRKHKGQLISEARRKEEAVERLKAANDGGNGMREAGRYTKPEQRERERERELERWKRANERQFRRFPTDDASVDRCTDYRRPPMVDRPAKAAAVVSPIGISK